MAIKCDKTFGADRHITKNYLTKAIDYAVNNGAEVINISYSAEKSDYDKFSELETSIKKAIAANVCVVCSAGNDSSTKVRYPAGFSGVIGVGATWKNGKLTKYSNESSAVDIVAPGGYSNSDGAQMFVTSPTTINSNGYRYSYGTSYATPHVSGTVAMMLSIHYGLTPAQILYRLQSRSTETVTGRIDTSKKYKFLNTGKSVELMKEE
jgi:subtilisin family serine protease